MAVLLLLFVLVPFAELYVLIQVGHVIGALPTVGLLIAVSIVGAWLVKREGLAVLSRARQRGDAGEVPGKELVDGVLVLLAGALLIAPGFLTDVVGVLLLLPPVRAVLRASTVRWLARRADVRVGRPW
ncbi:MAG: protein FxsA [Actinomycetota bacterium]|nr:protein FxsA [Actinomycetota bacterium]